MEIIPHGIEHFNEQDLEALGHSEKFYSVLFDNIADPVSIHDSEYNVIRINKAVERLFGKDVLGKKCYRAYQGRESSCPDCPTAKVLATGEPACSAEQVDTLGNIYQIQAFPLKDQQGSLVAVIEYSKDITKRKQERQELWEAKEWARALVDTASMAAEGIAVVRDTEGRPGAIVFVNDACARMSGYSKDELTRMSFTDLVSPKSLELVKEAYKRRRGGESVPSSYEVAFVKKDGQELLIEVSAGIVTYQGNLYTIAYLRDITERKRMESALRESERRYRLLVDNMLDTVFTTDMNLRLTYVSPSVTYLLGYSVEEAMRLRVDEMLTPASFEVAMQAFAEELAIEAREEKEPIRLGTLELEVKCKDGSTVWTEVKSDFVRGQDGRVIGLQGSARNITERRNLQQNMQVYIRQITRVQEEERKRLGRELHDDTIQGLVTLLLDVEAMLRAKGLLPDKAAQNLEQLWNKIRILVDGVRRFIHDLRPEVLDQLGLLPAVKLLMDDLSKASTIVADMEIVGKERRLSPEVELGLFRIIQEAIGNVRKHSEATMAAVKLEFMPDKVRATVTDDGKGFKLPRRLGDLATMDKLGLVGMRERAQSMNGNFSAQSKVGKGTTIVVEVADIAGAQ